MRRPFFPLACTIGLLATGCVEGEQTYTINPDGSGKVHIDVIMAPPVDAFGGPPGKADDSLEGLLRKHSKSLFESPGIDAWKDVSTSFAADGRLKFSGTAYFKKLDGFELKGASFLKSEFGISGQPEGPLAFTKSKPKKNQDSPVSMSRKKKTPEEIAKLTDAELDEYIFKEKIEYQSTKPLIRAILSDAKVKTNFILPGEISDVRGFKKDGPSAMSYTVDGNEMLKTIDKIFNQDNAELRKLYRAKQGMESALEAMVAGLPSDRSSATIAKPGKPLFDYDAEVKAARDAYPDLRKKLKLGDDIKLPDGTGPKRP